MEASISNKLRRRDGIGRRAGLKTRGANADAANIGNTTFQEFYGTLDVWDFLTEITQERSLFIMARGRQLKVEFHENFKLVNLAEEFFLHNDAKRLSKQTKDSYKRRIKKFIGFVGEDANVDIITPQLLDKYLKSLLDSGVKDVTAQTDMRHLRAFVRFCIRRGYIGPIDIPVPKVEETIKEPYSDEDMTKLLRKPQGKNWVEYRCWVMINYFFSTGQRLSTVINIKVKDLNVTNNTIKLTHNKDKIQKYMPLSTALMDVLTEYIYISGLDTEDYLFPEYEGGQLTVRGAQDSIADYNRSRGVDKTSIHLFRHTFAKNYIMNGGNPAKLQKLLNHKTIDMTMRYVALYGEDIAADLDLYNPLDNFKASHHIPVKRKRVE